MGEQLAASSALVIFAKQKNYFSGFTLDSMTAGRYTEGMKNPSMTRQHFQALADAVGESVAGYISEKVEADPFVQRLGDSDPAGVGYRNLYPAHLQWMVEPFVRVCQEFNPNFDRDRFLLAVGKKVDSLLTADGMTV
jgi:hypothetical protein